MKNLVKKGALAITIILGLSSYVRAQDATIHFNVRMDEQVNTGVFDPGSDFVDIAGTFNGWGGELTKLSDPDQDLTYSISISDFSVGQSIEFKFRQNGQWDGTEEFPGGGSNRQYTVQTTSDTIRVWYSDIPSSDGPPVANFEATPRATQNGSEIVFRNLSEGDVQFSEWVFEGGFPETSNEYSPTIFYSEDGTFDVQLIVGNSDSRDTLLLEDYIEISPRDISQLDWWNEVVFYEMFVRSFKDSDGDGVGDFQGAIEMLDYLNDGNPDTDDDLGINGIWLMPINPSPSYHGYDVTNYRGINPDYGTMDDFREFLDSCHVRGIRVIIDYVMNHSSTQHPWFTNSANNQDGKRDYYRWSSTDPGYDGPWGQPVWHRRNAEYYYGLFWGGMPDLNYREPEVRDEMLDIARYWLEDIGVDGFRIDAAKYLYEEGSNLENLPETIEFYQDMSTATKAVAPASFSVGEVWDDISVILPYVENDGLDYCFEFGLAGNILSAVNTGDADNLRARMAQVYSSYPHMQWGTFLTNHDQNRVMNEFGRNDAKHKVAAAIYLTLPGVPYIYYGEEVGMLGAKPDENIRRPMSWDGSAKAGFTTGSPWNGFSSNQTTHNVADQRGEPNSIFNRYRKLIQLRNNTPVHCRPAITSRPLLQKMPCSHLSGYLTMTPLSL